jgi:hypothetical protein
LLPSKRKTTRQFPEIHTDQNPAISSTSAATFGKCIGQPQSPSTGFTGGSPNVSYGIAIDASGNVWVANQASSSVTELIGAAAPKTPLISQVSGFH